MDEELERLLQEDAEDWAWRMHCDTLKLERRYEGESVDTAEERYNCILSSTC